jgi:hypothetical protein
VSLVVLLALVAGCGGAWGARPAQEEAGPPPGGAAYLHNPHFEWAVADRDGTLDPEAWEVAEGETTQGTGRVVREMPELVQVVGGGGGVAPHNGRRMLRVDARLGLKSSVRQHYRRSVGEGTLTQELAVRPPGAGEYVQQLEIRGRRDFREVEGLEMFHLRWTDEGLLLRVRTGSPDFRGQSGFYRIFPPLSRDRWSLFRITLAKAPPRRDGRGRTVSQWKLRVELNGDVLFDTEREGVYSQYIQSAEFVFIGDETMSGRTRKLDPRSTGDGIGIVYYDAASAWRR